ncbi:MAG TPA: C25 family cysteine peptidase, partial [Myxococcaceae bacterium]
PGDNVVQLVAPAPADVSLEQSVRLVYPRQTTRGTGALDFTLQGGTATRLQGFDAGLAHVLDVTDPDAPVRLTTWDVSGAAAVLVPGSGPRHLVAYLDADALAPASVLPNRPSAWNAADGAELVILGPSALFDAVKPLVERRHSEGLSVALVDIEDVQDEFASGEKSVDAVRGFLQWAVQHWAMPPRYVLLLGSATYDPRNYLGLAGDLVPSAVVQTSSLEAVSDSWFLAFAGSESMSVGRLPVRSVAQTQAVVAKILDRREATARSPLLLASDALGTSDFPEMTSDLRSDLPDAPATVIVRGSEPDDVLHQRFLDAAASGPALVNYTGHASELFWNGNLHTVGDVAALSRGGTSLWVHMTCLTGFFQDPSRQSLAVATLLSPGGGAWGAWGSTSMTYPTEHPALNRALVKALLVEGKTLGEATREAMAGLTDQELTGTFVLLGDPSARAVANSSSALGAAPKTGALGCTSAPGTSSSVAVLLAVAAWLAAGRRRARALRRR